MQYPCSPRFDKDSSWNPQDWKSCPFSPVLHLVIFGFPEVSADGFPVCFVFQQSYLNLFIPVSKLHCWIYRWPNREACFSKKKRERDTVGCVLGGGRARELMTEPREFFWHCPRLCHRLAPMEVLVCLFLMKSNRLEQCHIFHLGFLCPGCHDIKWRHGFCNN